MTSLGVIIIGALLFFAYRAGQMVERDRREKEEYKKKYGFDKNDWGF